VSRHPAPPQRAELVRVGQQLERRDPVAATRTLQWTSPGLTHVEEWNADKAFRAGYLANVIAYRCIQIIANAIAAVPIVSGRDRRKVNDLADSSRLSRLVGPPPGGPAPKLSARKLIRWTIAQQLVTGRRAWEIETDGNADAMPVAFWPLVSARLTAEASKGGTEWFRLFKYGPAGPAGMEQRTLQPGQVFYGWEPGGLDFRQAESPLQSSRYDLSLVTMCDAHSIAFLGNNAVPAAIVTTTAFPDDKTRERFQRQWASEFAGPHNAGRTAFYEVGDDGEAPVGEGIDVKVLGLSTKDARLVEQRKEAMAEIAMSLGVPWSKLDASGRTFDNAGVEDRTFWEERLLPLMVDLEDDINMQLAPRLGSEVCWFDLRGVRALQNAVKPVTMVATAPSLVQAQLITVNEARADYGWEPLPDGDRLMTIDEIVALRGGMAGVSGSERTVGEPERREVPAPPAAGDGEPGAPAALPAAVEQRVVDPVTIEARRARIWRAVDATVTSIESRWERAMRRLFARQQEATLSRLTGKRGRQAFEQRADASNLPGLPSQVASAAFDVDFWTAETIAVVEDLYEQAAGAGLDRLSMLFETAFDVEQPWVREFLEGRANQLAGQVTQTTYDAITSALADGVDAGESIDDLADRVRHVFSVANDARATTIARTEVISAYNGAASMGAAQLPGDVVAGQEWIATRDARTRDTHASADGQVVAVGQPFLVGGNQGAYPGDPSLPSDETVRCRCTVAFLSPAEFAEMSGRAAPRIEARAARMALAFVRPGEEFDELGFRRAALEAVA